MGMPKMRVTSKTIKGRLSNILLQTPSLHFTAP